MKTAFEIIAARRPDPSVWEDAPTREPMTPARQGADQRNPSTDQMKARRQQARKESAMQHPQDWDTDLFGSALSTTASGDEDEVRKYEEGLETQMAADHAAEFGTEMTGHEPQDWVDYVEEPAVKERTPSAVPTVEGGRVEAGGGEAMSLPGADPTYEENKRVVDRYESGGISDEEYDAYLEGYKGADEVAPKESAYRALARREREIVGEMQTASWERKVALSRELDDIRTERTRVVAADREIDLADTIIRDHLTPVATHTMHTAATDWLAEDTPHLPAQELHRRMAGEAAKWWHGAHEAVKADEVECDIQSRGVARRIASQYGLQAEAAEIAFMEQIEHLAERARTAAEKGSHEQGSGAGDIADESGQGVSGLPEEVTPTNSPEVFDNFQPAVAPENAAADASKAGGTPRPGAGEVGPASEAAEKVQAAKRARQRRLGHRLSKSAVKAIAIYPDKRIEEVEVNSLSDGQAIVGGLIQPVTLSDGSTMYVNEEGMYLFGPEDANWIAADVAGLGGAPHLMFQGLLGPAYIVGPLDDEGYDTDVTDKARNWVKRVAREAGGTMASRRTASDGWWDDVTSGPGKGLSEGVTRYMKRTPVGAFMVFDMTGVAEAQDREIVMVTPSGHEKRFGSVDAAKQDIIDRGIGVNASLRRTSLGNTPDIDGWSYDSPWANTYPGLKEQVPRWSKSIDGREMSVMRVPLGGGWLWMVFDQHGQVMDEGTEDTEDAARKAAEQSSKWVPLPPPPGQQPLFAHRRTAQYATVDEYMAAVDRAVSEMSYGMASVYDLPDQPFWDRWNDGVPPEELAREALENEGFPFEAARRTAEAMRPPQRTAVSYEAPTFARTASEDEGQCPACGGPSQSMGSLGSRNWYRCVNCGMDHSTATSARRTASDPKARLEELRQAIDAENISYGELHELQTMVEHIDPSDVQLLEWAGVPEEDYRRGIGASRRQAAAPIADESGQAVSGLPDKDVSSTTEPLDNLNQDMLGGGMVSEEGSSQPEGAADVGNIPTPGKSEGDYPQPPTGSQDTNLESMPMAARRRAFRARVQANLSPEDCLNRGEGCSGPVEYRMPLSGTGQSFPRCEKHWEERLKTQDRLNRDYPDSPVAPSWFDPAAAGERWDDDY